MPTSTRMKPGAARKRRTRAKHSPEHEAMEPKGHEASEMREGTEDSECCAEKTGKRRCAACDSGQPCSGRDDSLTAQDYLDACDLGIADRSRPYIRSRLDAMTSLTPSALRSDKKCGASAIPDNKQCRVGGGGGAPARGSRLRRGLEIAGMAGGAAAYGYGAGRAIQQFSKGNSRGALRNVALANAGSLAANAALLSRAKRTGNEQGATRARAGMALGYLGAGAALAGSGDFSAAGRAVRGAAGRGINRMRNGQSTAIVPYSSSGAGYPTATRGRSLGNRARRAYNATLGNSSSGRQARQGMRNAMNSAVFATRRGEGFTAANSPGSRARRAVYGASMAARRGAVSMSAGRRRNVSGGLAIRRRDAIWADGFSPEYAEA